MPRFRRADQDFGQHHQQGEFDEESHGGVREHPEYALNVYFFSNYYGFYT
jgi:hypothetical protein